MNDWIPIILPFMLVLGRVTAFFGVAPMFSWNMIPMRVRLSLALLMTIFFAYLQPRPEFTQVEMHWLGASVLLGQEVLTGLALGLAARFVFVALQQGILMGTQQMGFADAGIIDPSTGESQRPIGMIFQLSFAALFLAQGGHRLILLSIGRSYEMFPLGQPAEIAAMTGALLEASVSMFILALKIAAPLMAGFLLLAVIMGVLARVMPEMNILMASLPVRVGLGIFLSLAVFRTLNTIVSELAEWMDQFVMVA